MSAPHQPSNRAQRHDQARRPRPFAAARSWIGQHGRGTIIASTMVAIGLLLLAGFGIAAITGYVLSSSLLLFFGCALILFGGLLLLLDLIEWVARRLAHDRKYCGCCTQYKAQHEDYSVGLCLAAHSEGRVPRTHYCPYFHYSERAMVRDRLWQHRYMLQRLRSIQIESDQTGSDD